MALTKARNRMIEGARVNVKDFGAKGDGVTNDSVAIQAAIDSLDTDNDYTTGGVVYFPVGRYKILVPIVVRGGDESAEGLASITLQGEGMHNTIIDVGDGYTGDQAINVVNSTYSSFKDLQILGNNRTSYGLYVEDGSEIFIERIFCQNYFVSCFYFKRCFMVTMNQCRSKGGITGFDFSAGYNTSLSINNCYALNTNTAGQGFNIKDVSYSSFIACGADATGRHGYKVSNCAGVTFTSCGAENFLRSAWLFQSSTALNTGTIVQGTRCTLNECFSYVPQSFAQETGYGSLYSNLIDATSGTSESIIDVEVNRFFEYHIKHNISVNSTGVVSTDHKLALNNCRFKQVIRGEAAVINPIDVERVDNVSITSANTPVIDLASVFGNSLNYSGILHIVASNASPVSLSAANTSAYVLLVTKYTIGANSYAINVVEIAKNGLTTGGNTNHPSFTWTGDEATNQLEATPVGSTSGNFYFYIGQFGAINAS